MQSGTTNKYQLEDKEIAKGSYGKVFLAKDPTGATCIVKKIDRLFDNPISAYRILREIKILKRLKQHPNIISLNHIIYSEKSQNTYNDLSLVFEKMVVRNSLRVFSLSSSGGEGWGEEALTCLRNQVHENSHHLARLRFRVFAATCRR